MPWRVRAAPRGRSLRLAHPSPGLTCPEEMEAECLPCTSSPSTPCALCSPHFTLHPPLCLSPCRALKPRLYFPPVASAFTTRSSLLPWHCLDCAQDDVFSLLGSGPREQPWQTWPSHCSDAASLEPGAGELSQSRGSGLFLEAIWLTKNKIHLQVTYLQFLISCADMFVLFSKPSQKMLSKCHSALSGACWT